MNNTQENALSQPPVPYIHSWHYEMLINQERSQFYNDLLKDNCRDKVVLEIGTGCGLIAVLAIKNGAKKVICCEENPHLASVAMQLFKRLGLEDKIQLIAKNSKDIKTDEIPAVDIILHELFGSDPFEEEMVPTLKDARRFLKPGGIFLPEKLQIIYQPIRSYELQEKISFQGIELVEMNKLLSEIHPFLRLKEQTTESLEVYALPEVSVEELIETSYFYVENNDKLKDVDAVEVTFNIIHKNHKLQATQFGVATGRVHWFPLVFNKLDVPSNQIRFSLKDNIRLMML